MFRRLRNNDKIFIGGLNNGYIQSGLFQNI